MHRALALLGVQEAGCLRTSSWSRWMSAAASEADRVRSSRLFTMLPSRSSERRGVTCSPRGPQGHA